MATAVAVRAALGADDEEEDTPVKLFLDTDPDTGTAPCLELTLSFLGRDVMDSLELSDSKDTVDLASWSSSTATSSLGTGSELACSMGVGVEDEDSEALWRGREVERDRLKEAAPADATATVPRLRGPTSGRRVIDTAELTDASDDALDADRSAST
jgi:hypothetical protein